MLKLRHLFSQLKRDKIINSSYEQLVERIARTYVLFKSHRRILSNIRINPVSASWKSIISFRSLTKGIGCLMLELGLIMHGRIWLLNWQGMKPIPSKLSPMICLTLRKIERIISLSEAISMINLYKLTSHYNSRITILIPF